MGRLVNYVTAILRLHLRRPPAGLAWPPGPLNLFNRVNRRPQKYLLEKSAQFGPVFKQWMYGQHTTCIVGNDLGRRVLREGQSVLTSVTIDQTPLYPKGNLRTLQGNDHRSYRRLILEAINSTPIRTHEAMVRDVILAGLQTCIGMPLEKLSDIQRQALHGMLTDIMLLFTFGVIPGTETSRAMKAAYTRLGEKAPVNRIGDNQRAAFETIRGHVEAIASTAEGGEKPIDSFLAHLAKNKLLDPTLVGNLIYLVETIRFDVSSLWRWVLFYLASNRNVTEEIGKALHADRGSAVALVAAAINETLRLNQSEYLLRKVQEDFSYEGHFFPKNSRLRVCVWEGHKDPKLFAEPFKYRPDRFIEQTYTPEEFSPFGMDKHRCLGVDFTMDATQIFIETLLGNFALGGARIAEPEMGKHHWEPNRDFAVELMSQPVAGS